MSWARCRSTSSYIISRCALTLVLIDTSRRLPTDSCLAFSGLRQGVHDPLWDTLVWVRIALLTLVGLVLPIVSALVLRRREAGGGVVLVVDEEQEVQEA